MKWVNGIRIIKEIFDSYNEYNQLPVDSTHLIERLLDDLHYEDHKIKKDTLIHFIEVFPHLFEEDILNKLKNGDKK